ncbi:MAG TPA: cytochrome c maturation protein CcmE [Candidatus Methanoperedenaceae archaeon]|nr:cytochrome c maturation protein CcmE [Candidatus Methanoperedenaceae archaeon]
MLLLAYSTVSGYLVQYKTVSEALRDGSADFVDGRIQDGTFRNVRADTYQFVLTDGTAYLNVTFAGVLPSSFNPGSEIVVEGNLKDGSFNAERILAKCPSRLG